MQVVGLHRKNAQEERAAVEHTVLVSEPGVSDHAASRRPDRQISLLCGELLPTLRDMGGLCTGKFDADLITEGLDYGLLAPGTRLHIGKTCIEITARGKRCFDECPIRMRGERCPLPENCAFARVVYSGQVRVGDAITFERL